MFLVNKEKRLPCPSLTAWEFHFPAPRRSGKRMNLEGCGLSHVGVCGQDPRGMSLHLLMHLENVFPELLCPPGISQLPPAPQPGARLSEKLAASLIFSNLTASKGMGNVGAAAPGKPPTGGVPVLPSLSSWDWVIQLCRRLKSTSSLSQDPQGRMAAQPVLSHPGSLLLPLPEHSLSCSFPSAG